MINISIEQLQKQFPQLENITKLKVGGQKAVYDAVNAEYGNIVLKIVLYDGNDPRILREIELVNNNSFPNVPTIYMCLSSETLRFQDQLDPLLEKTEEWGLDGYYVIAAHPEGEYLVDDPVWLSNLLSFCAGLKLQRKEVVLGYSNHQMLSCACAGIDALASGTWMNVRSFTLDKFFTPDPDDIKRKRTWYYCPQALTEVKPEFLDIAFQRSILKSLAPLPEHNSQYANMLFSGAIPTTTAYSEPLSFKHYLSCMYSQCQTISKATFNETIDYQRKLLKQAGKLIDFMHKHGVRGQKRDFEDYIDVNLSAIDTFEADKGFLLKRMWNYL